MKFNWFLVSWNYCMMISFCDGESGSKRGLANILSPHTVSLWETLAVGSTFRQVSWKFGEWIFIFHTQTLNQRLHRWEGVHSGCIRSRISLYHQWEGNWQRMRKNGEVNGDCLLQRILLLVFSLPSSPLLSLQSIHWMCYISPNDLKF